MSNIVKKQNDLPTLKELVSDVGVYEKQDKLNFLLNQPPPEKWISKHPFIKIKNKKGQYVPYEYLPIDKVEYLIRKIFKRYRIEILREGSSFNGVYVVVRVWYWNFIYNEFDFHDGIGAIQLQTKKGSSPADLNNINNGALSMAYPHAETLAIKDATDMFGNLFGANLNERSNLGATMDAPSLSQEELDKKTIDKRILEHIKNSTSINKLRQVVNEIDDDALWEVYNNKSEQLENE